MLCSIKKKSLCLFKRNNFKYHTKTREAQAQCIGNGRKSKIATLHAADCFNWLNKRGFWNFYAGHTTNK